MEAFLVSAATVAVAEFGDKTQLLAILLAARFRRPVPIILGILAATILNHAVAAWIGVLAAQYLTPEVLRWGVGIAFLGVAVWALVPDKADEETRSFGKIGIFGTTAALFFLAEIGDKTQIATTLLGARFHALIPVTLGTTIGMMVTNVPAVLIGHKVCAKISPVVMRRIAAAIFAVLGILALVGIGL